MARLDGIYMEKDFYKPHEITGKQIDALRILGIDLVVNPNGSVTIRGDTAQQTHELCDIRRRDVMMRRVQP